MSINTKELIVQATEKLLFEKKVKTLTVKDIVEECHITRQAFYYHFSDIPQLLQWMLEQWESRILKDYLACDDMEERLKSLLLLAVHTTPYIRKGLETNYGKEFEQLIRRQTYSLAEHIAEKDHLYPNYSPSERQFLLRYHCAAIVGILQSWSTEDTKNIDEITHMVYMILSTEPPALS